MPTPQSHRRPVHAARRSRSRRAAANPFRDRAAGAPQDKAAGVDLLCQVGRHVQAGQPLYRIHASSPHGLSQGLALATSDSEGQTAVRVEPQGA